MVTTALALIGLLALRVGIPLLITLVLSEVLQRRDADEASPYGRSA